VLQTKQKKNKLYLFENWLLPTLHEKNPLSFWQRMQFVSITRTSQLPRFRQKIGTYCENEKKPTNRTLCGKCSFLMLHQVVHRVRGKPSKENKVLNFILMEYVAASLYIRSYTLQRVISAKRQEHYPWIQTHIPEKQILILQSCEKLTPRQKKKKLTFRYRHKIPWRLRNSKRWHLHRHRSNFIFIWVVIVE